MLAFEVASFYTHAAARGQWNSFNKFMQHGYVPGQPIGNGVVAVPFGGGGSADRERGRCSWFLRCFGGRRRCIGGMGGCTWWRRWR